MYWLYGCIRPTVSILLSSGLNKLSPYSLKGHILTVCWMANSTDGKQTAPEEQSDLVYSVCSGMSIQVNGRVSMNTCAIGHIHALRHILDKMQFSQNLFLYTMLRNEFTL